MSVALTLAHLFPDIVLPDECVITLVDGVEVIERWARPEPQPTRAELLAAWPAAQAKLAADEAARKLADEQQQTGKVEARKAYDQMQTIINGADTATTGQLRAAVKQMATTLQHLIRAAAR